MEVSNILIALMFMFAFSIYFKDLLSKKLRNLEELDEPVYFRKTAIIILMFLFDLIILFSILFAPVVACDFDANVLNYTTQIQQSVCSFMKDKYWIFAVLFIVIYVLLSYLGKTIDEMMSEFERR